MGCASSHLLNHDDDFTQIGSSALGHHIVSLTSTTYGLLTLDPSSSQTTASPTPPSRITLVSIFPTSVLEPRSEPPPEVINSWELMAGLDFTPESFRFQPQAAKTFPCRYNLVDEENSNPNKNPSFQENSNPNQQNPVSATCVAPKKFLLDGFEDLCPPKGENKVVIYTTTLRGVPKTFEACNAVRAAMEGHGVFVCERDISMDEGFREELRELMKGKDRSEWVPPRVFVKGRYVGGAKEVLRIMEEGCLGEMVEGLPRTKVGYVCEGCGGGRFLPCSSCNGSRKMVMDLKEGQGGKRKVVQCGDCNENGLVRCPICS